AQGHYRVTRGGNLRAIAVTRAHVDQASLRIDRRRIPNAGTTGAPNLGSDAVLADLLYRLRNNLRAPNNFSLPRIERHHGAARLTTFNLGHETSCDPGGSQRHVQTPGVVGRTAR